MTVKTIPIISGKPNAEDNNDTPAQKDGDGIPNGAYVADVINNNASYLQRHNDLLLLSPLYYTIMYDLYDAYNVYEAIEPMSIADYILALTGDNTGLQINDFQALGNTYPVDTNNNIVQVGTIRVNSADNTISVITTEDSFAGSFPIYLNWTTSQNSGKLPIMISVIAAAVAPPDFVG